MEADVDSRPAERCDGWDLLLGELDRPLTPGFMTAGYTALGRYIFLCQRDHPDPVNDLLAAPRSGSRVALAFRRN